MIPKVKYYGPRIPSTYAVNMTAAASGSNGITVADDDDIDFGTGDFFLHWEGGLPDWTPNSGAQDLINKLSASVGYRLVIGSTALGFPIVVLNATTYAASIANTLVNGAIAKITAVIVRETASSAGSVTFYINGIPHGTAVAISSGVPATISNAVSAYASGTSTARTASNTLSCIVGNFAPTAAEVLDLCTNGIPASWKWGSQAATWTSNWGSGVDGFVAISSPATIAVNVDGISDGTTSKDNCLRVDKNATAGTTGAVKTSGTLLPNTKNGWVKLSIYVPAGQSYIDGFIITRGTITTGTVLFDGTGLNGQWVTISKSAAPASSNPQNDRIYIYALDGSSTTISGSASGELFYIADGSSGQAGATMALLPDTIPTSSATTWSDSSGNTGGGTLPAAGATKVTIRR